MGGASLILIAGFLGSRALGVLRNMVLAQAFGAGPELDAYFAAFRLPDTLFQLIAGAVLGSAFLPTFTRMFTQVSEAAAWRLASAALSIFTGLGAVAALLAFAAAPWLVPLTAPGFAPEQQRLTVDLSRIMLLSTVAFCASGMVTGVLNSRSHFLLGALAPWAYNLSIIVGTLLFAGVAGPAAAAWGVAVGAALHLLVQIPGLRLVGMRWFWAGVRTPGLQEVARLMGPRVFALGASQLNWLAATLLASNLAAGSITALNYGWALAMLPLGLFGMAPATAAFPALAEAAALGQWERYRTTLVTGLQWMLFLAIPSAVGLLFLGRPAIALLFERGEFDAGATTTTAMVLSWFALGLPAHVTLEMASRACYALADTRTPLVFALAGAGVNIALAVLLSGPLGAGGLALAMSLAAIFEAGGLLMVVAGRTQGWRWRPMAVSVGKSLTASLGMAAALWLVAHAVGGLSPLAALLALVAVGGGAFWGGAAALRMPEAWLLLRGVVQRLRPAAKSPML
jgi:putative peptidoglycan lipid II flippase